MNRIFRVFVGLVLLLSGLLKAIDTATFANLMSEYGADWFGYAAPFVIAVELILALLLIFNVYPRLISLITVGFVVTVSFIFLYGITCRGITNCGCFGSLTWLNTKPWLTFLRNAILIILLVPSLWEKQTSSQWTYPVIMFMALVSTVVMFMCGFSFRGAKCLQKKQVYQPIAMSDSPLASIVTTDKDSTYLVFAFSYSCPFCLNSIGNVNQYTQMHVVDKVIGLAVYDSVYATRFHQLFETNFEIQHISPFEMYKIASSLPIAFMIRQDTIVDIYSGLIISPALIMQFDNAGHN